MLDKDNASAIDPVVVLNLNKFLLLSNIDSIISYFLSIRVVYSATRTRYSKLKGDGDNQKNIVLQYYIVQQQIWERKFKFILTKKVNEFNCKLYF
ncbi:hypothetical protein RCL_jg6764.t1 [Rhizophagus clarus]|uniref:Uncharacterized protein n=1 Tax=Rhizophagus clarus TaxID=94130 RepID=A0A8H3LER7_9GLOM|nr:hypothetical protein RCL_jg6764.t1 [Rhizophagus clarus]